jgi:hypothetical protein
VRSNLEIDTEEPSGFSRRFDLDADEAIGILCADIKRGLFDAGGEGFMDGFVTIYSSKPLTVKVVVTGENEGGHSMQIDDVGVRRGGIRVRPSLGEV